MRPIVRRLVGGFLALFFLLPALAFDVCGWQSQQSAVNEAGSSQPPPGPTVVVEGQKTWFHGDNPAAVRPASIVVLVYGDGRLARQLRVTAADGWRYRFRLPQYAADGHEIVYTIDEQPVEGYDKAIDGYDLINTYRGPADPTRPTDPPGPTEPENPGGPPTGDPSNPWPAFLLLIASLLCMAGTLRWGRAEQAYTPRHAKR